MMSGDDVPVTGDLILTSRGLRWQVHAFGLPPALSWGRYQDAVTALRPYARARAVDIWKAQGDGGFERVLQCRVHHAYVRSSIT
jgi:hypothetical protein